MGFISATKYVSTDGLGLNHGRGGGIYNSRGEEITGVNPLAPKSTSSSGSWSTTYKNYLASGGAVTEPTGDSYTNNPYDANKFTQDNVQFQKDNYDKIIKDVDSAKGIAQKGMNEAGVLGTYSNYLAGYGQDMYKSGKGLLNWSNDLMGLNPNATGIIGEYVNTIKKNDPDRYVSLAASDVQNSYSNAESQLNRALSRQGLDSDSTRTVSMRNQYAQSLAAALAGAKTRARQMGLNEQTTMLRNALSDAMALNNQGSQLQQQGASLISKAAETKGTQVSLLYNGAASILSAIQAQTQAGAQVSSAYKDAADMLIQFGNYQINKYNSFKK